MKYILCFLFLSFCMAPSVWADNEKTASRSVAQEAKVLIQDIVHRIEKDDSGYRVMFRVHAGVYRLKPDSNHYDSIASALKESRESGELIEVKADSTSLEIEELVLKTK